MKLNFKNFPTGSLPYNDIQPCKQMMLRLFEKNPFLPELPLMDENDTLLNRTFQNMPCVTIKDGNKILLPENNNDRFTLAMLKMDKIYNNPTPEELQPFSTTTPYFDLYIEILKKLKPEYTIINMMGPFTFANSVFNRSASVLLMDRIYNKFIYQIITLKALWYVSKVKEASNSTKPIIVFDEALLYKFGTLKRNNETITKDTASTLMTKVFQKVKKMGGVVCVQSFAKCNWQIVFDTGAVDIISFDAYNNPNNLNIIASSVFKFLMNGGIINWGIIPTMNENAIRSLNIDTLYNRLINTIEDLASQGVPLDLIYGNSTISIQSNLSNQPIIFAEKALMIADKLSKKLPTSSAF